MPNGPPFQFAPKSMWSFVEAPIDAMIAALTFVAAAAVVVGVDEDSTPGLSWASAVCVAAPVQPPTTSTSAVMAASSMRSRGRLTRAG